MNLSNSVDGGSIQRNHRGSAQQDARVNNQAQLEQLESRVAIKPNDLPSIRRLVTLLDLSGPQIWPSGAFGTAQTRLGLTGMRAKISHGCSEYGLEYPDFKYSETDEGRRFETPPQWQKVEDKHFAQIKLPPAQTQGNTKPYVSLRDVFAFRTWIKYASLIGDETCRKFHAAKGPDLPAAFVKRVTAQATLRRDEMQELAAQA